MNYDKTDEVTEKRFELLFDRYHISLEISMRGSDFIFSGVNLLHYKCHKINLKCGGSCIDSPNWIKKKKATINPINDDDKCFQYPPAVKLIMKSMKKICKEYQKLSLFK